MPNAMQERYESAATIEEFIGRAEANQELWRSLHARAVVAPDLAERAKRLQVPRHLLVLAEDWCGDAVNTLPALARLAEAAPDRLDLRVLRRDENPDLMNAHLSDGARAIPVVIVLDEHYQEVGWWGSRPFALQAWVKTDGQELTREDRYREVRRWYARDRGRTTHEEVLSLLERSTPAPSAGQPLGATPSPGTQHRDPGYASTSTTGS